MSASIINCANPKNADVVILSANYDVTSSFGKGADKGPEAIVKCLETQIEFLERFSQSNPSEKKKIAHVDLGDLNNLSPEAAIKKIREAHHQYFKAGKFVLTLGGEHSVSNGPFESMARELDPKDVTLFHIDAHFDLRIDDSDYNDKPYGKYAHACVLRRGCELGYRTTHVGIRAYSKDEWDFAKKRKETAVFEWGRGPVPSSAKIVASLKTKKVYVTIDVDGLDPAFMPATGTAVQGGLEWYYTLNLLSKIFKEREVIGADIMEVAPRAADTLTEYGAAQIVYHMIASKFMKHDS